MGSDISAYGSYSLVGLLGTHFYSAMKIFTIVVSLSLWLGFSEYCLAEFELSSDTSKGGNILFKKPHDSNSPEFTTGAYYIFNTKDSTSHVLVDNILVDHCEAWISKANLYVVFSSSGIQLFDKNINLVERYDFKTTELVVGAQYLPDDDKVYFLLKNQETNKIDLCQFLLKNKELKKVIQSINVGYGSIEEPFKRMFFQTPDNLLIEDYCLKFVEVNLKSNQYRDYPIDEKNCFIGAIARNSKGILFVKYKTPRRYSYELKEYDFLTKKSELLLDGENQYSKYVRLKLFSEPDRSTFVVQVDNKLLVYNYEGVKELKIDFTKVLAFCDGNLLYSDARGKIRSKRLI